MKLTQATVAGLTLPPGKNEVIIWDDDCAGLAVRLRGDSRRWIVQYRIGRRQRRESLGDTRKVKLDDARKIARQRYAKVKLGHDPVEERRKAEARALHTLGHVADLYLEAKQDALRPGTYKQMKLHLTEHWKPLRKLPIGEITRADVALQLQRLTKERGKTAAGRARTNLSTLCSWAMKEGLCEANPVIATNDPDKGAKPRERALTDAELRIVWNACGNDDIGKIARLLILTGCRRGEIGQLIRSEVVDGVMTIPGVRTKNKRPLVLTLPPAALAILESVSQQGGRDFYFGVRGRGYSTWSTGKKQIDAKITANTGMPLDEWRWHDLRRTMRSGLGAIGIRPDVAERAVNHVRGKIEEIYDKYKYGPEIARALALWADHVAALAEVPGASVRGHKKTAPPRQGRRSQ
jgi:integrase